MSQEKIGMSHLQWSGDNRNSKESEKSLHNIEEKTFAPREEKPSFQIS